MVTTVMDIMVNPGVWSIWFSSKRILNIIHAVKVTIIAFCKLRAIHAASSDIHMYEVLHSVYADGCRV